jgi:hypothetical protein
LPIAPRGGKESQDYDSTGQLNSILEYHAFLLFKFV